MQHHHSHDTKESTRVLITFHPKLLHSTCEAIRKVLSPGLSEHSKPTHACGITDAVVLSAGYTKDDHCFPHARRASLRVLGGPTGTPAPWPRCAKPKAVG